MRKTSQKHKILEFLLLGGNLTTTVIRDEFSLKDPKKAISNLRREGFDIVTSGNTKGFYLIPRLYLKENLILYTKLYEN